jgi:D-3-phosphoglycerate dehydrogenase
MSLPPWNVLVVDPIHPSAIALLDAQQGISVTVVAPAEEAVLQQLATADAVSLRNFRFTAEHVAAATRLKVVSRHGVGFDSVDIDALTQRGIPLALALGTNAISVAEHAFALILGLLKQLSAYDAAVRRDGMAARSRYPIRELYNKELLLIGFGRIGREVARRALAFGARVAVFDPYAPADALKAAGVSVATDLDVAIASADIISLHLPLVEETRNILSPARINVMKPGALVVNCARPGLVDEEALANAIAEGRIGGAGLDTFAQSISDTARAIFDASPFVIRSPYVAALAEECVERTSVLTAENILAARAGTLEAGMLANPATVGTRRV